DDVQLTARRNAAAELLGERGVDKNNLERPPLQVRSESCQGCIAQAAEVSPENGIDEPLALENAHRSRVHVGPPVRLQQVRGNLHVRAVEPAQFLAHCTGAKRRSIRSASSKCRRPRKAVAAWPH